MRCEDGGVGICGSGSPDLGSSYSSNKYGLSTSCVSGTALGAGNTAVTTAPHGADVKQRLK